MEGKIALVTGANAGMGRATVEELADRGFHVVMLCRSEGRGRAALDEIVKVPGRSVSLMLCDLGDHASIRRFAAAFRERYGHLDVLVNSAGVITLDRRETADHLELQFGVNHIGHFLLTLLLLPALGKAPAGRIVQVGSGAHWVGRIWFEDVNLRRRYNVVRSYGQSKLANLLFVRELNRRLRAAGSAVTVNCAHPGAVATQMGIDRDTGFGKTIVAMLRPFFLTAHEGARTAVFLAADESMADITGEYFYRSKLWRTSKRGRNMEDARRLFALSEQIVGFTFEDAMKG